jgi:hypothetical protein
MAGGQKVELEAIIRIHPYYLLPTSSKLLPYYNTRTIYVRVSFLATLFPAFLLEVQKRAFRASAGNKNKPRGVRITMKRIELHRQCFEHHLDCRFKKV